MFEMEVLQVVARERRETYERQAEINRMLKEDGEKNGKEVRVSFASHVLYAIGRLLVRAGSSLQRPYCETLEMSA